MSYQYSLEKYSGKQSRFECPRCGEKGQFTRYVDSSGRYLSKEVGICNNRIRCKYHYPPSLFFRDNKHLKEPQQKKRETIKVEIESRNFKQSKLSNWTIPDKYFENSLKNYHKNNFTLFLTKTFGNSEANKLIRKFCIGTTNHFDGATVFWQIDIEGRKRTGKIIAYNPVTGKRIRHPYDKINWLHSILIKQKAITNFSLKQCLFGEHLLKNTALNTPVAIVESEKTAIIASIFIPNFVWLACGGINNLTAQNCIAIKNRKIILYPDTNGYDVWRTKAEQLEYDLNCNITISSLLENKTSMTEKERGLDIADYLVTKKNLA
ncbi:MAG: hypothetical protein KDH98_08935 [Calditrichaeota bacterium]|nr:hypothetical protein [Calditrichota bacterium]